MGGNYLCDESQIPECIQNHQGLEMGLTIDLIDNTESISETPQCCGDTGSDFCNCEYWWFDETKNNTLNDAIEHKKNLPLKPIDMKYWPDYLSKN